MDMPAAGDDQPRPAHDRLSQQLAGRIDDERTRSAGAEPVEPQIAGTLVERCPAERADQPAVGRNADPSGEGQAVATLTTEHRDEGEALAAACGLQRVREDVPVAAHQGVVAALGEDPHRAAAHEARVPGELLVELVSQNDAAAVAPDASRDFDRVAFDAPAAERARRPQVGIDRHHHAGADRLRRAPLRAHDGRQREVAALRRKLGHPLVQGGGALVSVHHLPFMKERSGRAIPCAANRS
jgi:hypothetical protein